MTVVIAIVAVLVLCAFLVWAAPTFSELDLDDLDRTDDEGSAK